MFNLKDWRFGVHNGVMDINTDHRNDIIKRLTRDLLDAMEKNQVTEADLPQIADFILEKVDKAQNHELLIKLIDELSQKWSFFEKVEQLERGEVKEHTEDKAEKDVLMLVKSGRTEEAINLAKSVMKV